MDTRETPHTELNTMKIVLTILLFLLSSLSLCAVKAQLFHANDPWDSSLFFNTRALSNEPLIHETLIQQGFKTTRLTASDGIVFECIYKQKKDARYSVIICSGWPGTKEKGASLYAMLRDEPCNILLFDSRSSGKTAWPIWRRLWQFGQHEYKDIQAAIRFANSFQCPIFLYGTCAGAFHAAHALLDLEKKDDPLKHRIRGLVFDSGWSDVDATSRSVAQEKIDRSIKNFLLATHAGYSPEKMDTSVAYTLISASSKSLLNALHFVLFKPFFKFNASQTNLLSHIDSLQVPILFIHSYDDKETPFIPTYLLYLKAPLKTSWWIKRPSRHSCHFLKYKHEYQRQLITFFNAHLESAI